MSFGLGEEFAPASWSAPKAFGALSSVRWQAELYWPQKSASRRRLRILKPGPAAKGLAQIISEARDNLDRSSFFKF